MDDEQMNKLLERQGNVQEKLDHLGAWDLDQQLEMAMDALRCPPPEAAVQSICPAANGAASRCAGCCCRSRTCLSSTSRRTISTPSPSVGSSSTSSDTRAPSSRSPTIAISWTTWPAGSWNLTAVQGIPWKGNYSSWLEQKRNRLSVEEEEQESARQKALAHELEWVRAVAASARQAKSKARVQAPTRRWSRRGPARKAKSEIEIYIPPGPRLGDRLSLTAVDGHQQVVWRQTAVFHTSRTSHCRRAASLGVIGPNGSGKTTLFRLITGNQDTARRRAASRSATSVKLAYMEQSIATALSDGRQRLAGHFSDGAGAHQAGGTQTRSTAAAWVSHAFGFTGTDQQKKLSEISPAASAIACPPGTHAQARRQRHPAGRADQ